MGNILRVGAQRVCKLHHPLMPKRIFISHDLEGTPEAVQFMEILDLFPDLNSAFFWPRTEILWVLAGPGSLLSSKNCETAMSSLS